MSVNKVILVGRLGKDPETKQLRDGSVTNFSLATSEQWNDKSGKKQERTEWHNCVAWGKAGEIIGKYVRKGSELYVEGQLRTESYEKDGVKQYRTKVYVKEFSFIGGGKKDERREERGRDEYDQRGGYDQSDDDVPF